MNRHANNSIKISIITWDASFRESFHTVDSFGQQNYQKENFELLWVDYYNNENKTLAKKISQYKNTRLLNLNRPKNEKWHLGKCINEGIKNSSGEILVIPDGDIIVPKHFLELIESELTKIPDLVLYFRRWDEPKSKHSPRKSYTLSHLGKNCLLTNPTNYAGTIALNRKTLAKVNFFETHKVFSGPGSIGKELYIRLRNANFPIKWHKEKIYHPFHEFTGVSDKQIAKDNPIQNKYPWIIPYSGIKQSWVIYSRSLNLNYKSDKNEIDAILENLPNIYSPKSNDDSFFLSLKAKIKSILKTKDNNAF